MDFKTCIHAMKRMIKKMDKTLQRCWWAGNDPVYVKYHDEEWGVPVHDDTRLFEFIILEGAQAGLSWLTILKKRQGYRKAFAEFNAEKIAGFTREKIQSLMKNPEIVRNRLKIEAAITNARAFLRIQEEFGSFDRYAWRFVDGRPIINHFNSPEQVPATTRESDMFSKDLKQRGFKFTGSTIIYAHMQATGMVNDHLVSCFRHAQVQAL
jgi:DNA-3-methyladenine glycosylase I